MTDKQSKDTADKAKPASANKKADTKVSTKASMKTGAKAEAKAGAKAPAKKAAAKPMTAAEKKSADQAIRSKQSADDLKARAAAAKKRAQEKILEKSFVSDPPEDPLERLANTFDNSARRWEMVVYPSLFAFVLLAGYGFFLIYRLTHDIAVLSQSVTHMAVIVSDAMPRMSKDLNTMTGSMDNMTGNIAGMSTDIDGMTTEIGTMSNEMSSLTPMSKNIQSMTHNIGSMNRSVYGMQRDIGGMNRTVSSGPFGMMNDMMPFSSSSNVPRPMAPPQIWPSYNPVSELQYKRAVQAYPHPATVNQAEPKAARKATVTQPRQKKATEKKSSDNAAIPLADSRQAKKKVSTKELSMPGSSPVSLKPGARHY